MKYNLHIELRNDLLDPQQVEDFVRNELEQDAALITVDPPPDSGTYKQVSVKPILID